MRTCQSNKTAIASATDRKRRVKAFRGISGLVDLDGFDLVKGIMPAYKHGLLLWLTKTLMKSMWF